MLRARLVNKDLALRFLRQFHSGHSFWPVVDSPAFQAFIQRVSHDLHAFKSGIAITNQQASSSAATIAQWQRIVDANAALQTAREELEQLDELSAEG